MKLSQLWYWLFGSGTASPPDPRVIRLSAAFTGPSLMGVSFAQSLIGMARRQVLISLFVVQVLADGAIGYWRLGEASGLTLADATGNGHAATLPDAIGVGYGVAGALSDGTTGFSTDATVGASGAAAFAAIALGTTFTLEVWVNPKAGSPTSYGTLIATFGGGGLGFYWNDAAKKFDYYDGGDHFSGAVLPYGTLYHAVLSVSAGAATLYVNGAPSASFTVTTPFSPSRLLNSAGDRLASNLIDEIVIYPTALSAAQVATHYSLRTPVIALTRAGFDLTVPDLTAVSWLDAA